MKEGRKGMLNEFMHWFILNVVTLCDKNKPMLSYEFTTRI